MNIRRNVSFAELTTMKLGGSASFVAEITSELDVETAYIFAAKNQLKTYILGGGSNTIARDAGFGGLVLLNKITGINVVKKTTSGALTLKIGSGEVLDNVVNFTTKRGLTGLEALSSIPGTIGGGAIQNSGAYGQELAPTIHSVEVFDTTKKTFLALSKADIDYGYRHSIFNSNQKGRYFITAVCLTLKPGEVKGKLYTPLQNFLDANGFSDRSPQTIRNAVMSIRATKLPDPKIIPSAGSFFKNTTISADQAQEYRQKFPNMPLYKVGQNWEISSGWLIEQTGLKGQVLHGMLVSNQAALILINQSARNYADLDAARQTIIDKVHKLFNIKLEQEPEEITS
jgi:UDP-N-acetylmuramate dehydrogenase